MKVIYSFVLAAVGALAQTVILKQGAVVGTNSNSIDTFKGIPYALPPTGTRRLRAPASTTASYPGGTFLATSPSPTVCPQFNNQVTTTGLDASATSILSRIPLFNPPSAPEGEDCLNLNVQRPQGTTSGSNLPVVVWIYGGAFTSGSTTPYDGTPLISAGVSTGNPIIFVQMNYRVNAFGFLAGSQLSADGNTNLGLRDQRLALQWVQDNIGAFGGDPTKVTIWGQSAGSISVYDQLIVNGGNNLYNGKALFRGAIMSSGSTIATQSINSTKAQNIFNTVAQAAGCPINSNVLTCLRSVSYQTFRTAAFSVPAPNSYRSLDVSYLPRPDPNDGGFFSTSPEAAILNGKYAKVPVIMGSEEDDGTIFALPTSNISTTADVQNYFQSYFTTSSASAVNAYINTYPDDPAAGSPFRTGNANNLYAQYKRMAAIFGDYYFNLQRRLVLKTISSTVPSWSYICTYLHNLPFLGTPHGGDVIAIYTGGPDADVANTLKYHFVSFITYLDPNRISNSYTNKQTWTQYTNDNLFLLNITGDGLFSADNQAGKDDYRVASANTLQYLWSVLKL